jgi:hypothetical protein
MRLPPLPDPVQRLLETWYFQALYTTLPPILFGLTYIFFPSAGYEPDYVLGALFLTIGAPGVVEIVLVYFGWLRPRQFFFPCLQIVVPIVFGAYIIIWRVLK